MRVRFSPATETCAGSSVVRVRPPGGVSTSTMYGSRSNVYGVPAFTGTVGIVVKRGGSSTPVRFTHRI